MRRKRSDCHPPLLREARKERDGGLLREGSGSIHAAGEAAEASEWVQSIVCA